MKISKSWFMVSNRFRKAMVELPSSAMFAVFLYAGVDKTMNHLSFMAALLRTDYLPEKWVIPFSYFIPALEILLAMVGLLTPYSKGALWGIALLLTLFTVHLAWLMQSPGTPCSCGGIFNALPIFTHILVNLALLLIALLLIYRKNEGQEIKG